jgi:hypothetical protein
MLRNVPRQAQRMERPHRNERERDPSDPIPLAPRGDGPVPLVFRRGAHAPYATRWFGITSLAGHARNFASSAIAAESIDARDWMRPTTARELLSHIVGVLGGDPTRPTLVEALGRPTWIDFVADTGDDHDVSRAVASMIFATYSVNGGREARELPRGDVLLFGGDTAYPVATGEEIARRLIAPFNDVLRERAQPGDPARVILGIAGNHDWYDGLDGFGRLFRRSPHGTRAHDAPNAARRSLVPRHTGIVARQLHLDEVGGLMKLVANAGSAFHALWVGTKIGRPRRLSLIGYHPVQEASYWALPVAPGLEAWGVDRQLGYLDYRQRQFFGERHPNATIGRVLFVAPDPAIAFGEPHAAGARMLAACRLSLERHRVFYLTGDMHHYERRHVPKAQSEEGEAHATANAAPAARARKAPTTRPDAARVEADGEASLHVIAGGGGAFLHGTRIGPYPGDLPARVYPSGEASRRLVFQVPFKLMVGSAGFILHVALGFIAAFELGTGGRPNAAMAAAAAVSAVGITVALYTRVGHNRAHPRVVLGLAIPFGAVLGLLPVALRLASPRLVSMIPTVASDMGIMVVYAFLGAFIVGVFLATIAVLGLEPQQAFSVLSHPGFKHFVRLCVHPDGRIEAWVIGKDDPLSTGPATLIDQFEWP